MMLGVLVEIVNNVSQNERDDRDISVMKETILVYLNECDDGDGFITNEEFLNVVNRDHCKELFHRLNIDRVFLIELQKAIFPRGGCKVPIARIMEWMLICRSDLNVTVCHLACAQASLMYSLNDAVELMDQSMQDHTNSLLDVM